MIHQKTIEQVYKKHYKDGTIQYSKRLLTGLCHYVFLVEDNRGRQLIFRIAQKELLSQLKGSLYWLRLLKGMDIPVPIVYHTDFVSTTPYMIMDYKPGRDLLYVYGTLTKSQKEVLAESMVDIQHQLECRIIPKYSNHYGYLTSFEDSHYKENWYEVVKASVERSAMRMLKNAVFDYKLASNVEALLKQFQNRLMAVPPTPFFHDATTKNVVMDQGALSVIVDHDEMAFGDPLYQLALTHCSLLSSQDDTYYTEYWLTLLNPTAIQKQLFNFYVLCFIIDFMSEAGMRFNRDEPLIIPEEEKSRLLEIYDIYYKAITE